MGTGLPRSPGAAEEFAAPLARGPTEPGPLLTACRLPPLGR
ncbi:hypothetical protein [Streptomyces sp. NRRL S-1521]|nr:hypothetical protein [Streptomyces sp. NRRL S-1521]